MNGLESVTITRQGWFAWQWSIVYTSGGWRRGWCRTRRGAVKKVVARVEFDR